MLVANSFDLWQKDTFFSAAEELQESAAIMESAYRTWVRQRREGVMPQILDELCRDLQTALGTAKWQLEKFERAVSLSYRNRTDDVTTARHRQFVAAIENQISHVEAALKEERKQPLRWVTLDEEECDDLAAFLSGVRGTSQNMKNEYAKFGASGKSTLPCKHNLKKDLDLNAKVASKRGISNQTNGFTDASYVIELEAQEIPGTRDDIKCQADSATGTRRTCSSLDIGALKIVIDHEDEQKKTSMLKIEVTPKEKGLKQILRAPRVGEHQLASGGILSYTHLRGTNLINQLVGRVRGSQRHLQTSLHLQFGLSIQFTLALMLTIFLIVPFLLYST